MFRDVFRVQGHDKSDTSYRGADKSLVRPTSRFFFDGESISFDASLYIYIYMYNTNFLQLWL